MSSAVFLLIFLISAALPALVRSQDLLSTTGTGFPDFLKEREELPGRQLPTREITPLEGAIDPSAYYLGPHDEVTIGIWDEISMSIPLQVTPEGTIIFSPAGLIDIRDLTIKEAEEKVRDILGTYYPDVTITLTLTAIRRIKVHISGEVYYPGSYEVSPVDRLFDIIQMAGGFLSGGSVRNISIKRMPSGETLPVDLDRFLQDGEIEGNPILQDGDIVYIPPKTNMVLVKGEVHGKINPSMLQQRTSQSPEEDVRGVKTEIFLEYREGDLLSEAIMRAGGLLETADLNGSYILRRGQPAADSIIPVDLYSLFIFGDPSADLPLRKGDIIEIPQDSRNVFVTGIVNEPGPIPYQANTTAYEYVGMAGGPTINGSSSGWKVYDQYGKKKKIKPDDFVEPGETVVVPERFLSKLGKVLSPTVAVSTLIISIVALQR
jgi:protein involved in polysaccharide export with SLBB domain